MRLLRLRDVPVNERDRVFRSSRERAVVATVAVSAASVGLVAVGWFEGRWLAYYVAGVLLVGLVVLRRFVTARFRTSNWLVRMGDAGLWIQFRSYLNFHFPADDLTVVLIPFGEIRSARRVREQRDIPDRENPPAPLDRITRVSRRLVELELAVDAAPLVRALGEEAARRAPAGSTYRHHPVRMVSSTALQLEWGVVPRADVLLDALRPYARIGLPSEVSRDYTSLERLSRDEQERLLLDLAETGQTMAAIQIARTLYSYDLAHARGFVEGLRAKARGAGQ